MTATITGIAALTALIALRAGAIRARTFLALAALAALAGGTLDAIARAVS